MHERPVEVHTDHRCVLAILARRLSESRDGDRAALAADAVDVLLRTARSDRCCVPRYLALAPERASSEVQIPIGARDSAHSHDEGWAVFAPVVGSLEAVSIAVAQQARFLVPTPERRAGGATHAQRCHRS